jgi:hypothetical protein
MTTATKRNCMPALQLPDGPYVQRDSASPTLTPAGVAVIESMARELFTQEEIAAKLGLSAKVFRSVLGKATDDPMTPARAAWESGIAANKGELQRLALSKARGGAMVETLFLLKSVHGFRDQGPAVQVDAGPRINFYSLPRPMSEKDYFESLGIDGPIDTRPMHMRVPPMQAMGLLPSPTESNPAPTEGGGSNADESKAANTH